jgi:hypothetical protein
MSYGLRSYGVYFYVFIPLDFHRFRIKLLVQFSHTAPLQLFYLIILLSYIIVTTSKSLYILVSLLPKVVAAIDSVVTYCLGSMLFNFFYRNRSSNCVTNPYSRYYGRVANRLGM